MSDPKDITTGTVEANGLDFGYLETGPPDGPLALCLHGFPDSPHTWRPLLADLAAAGYRAVAPFMRGYAPTAVPADGAYQTGALASDAVALHEALDGGADAVVIGHDWGAAATYGAANLAPDRWRRAVAMAVPPIDVLVSSFFAYEQLKRSFYVFVFQTALAETILNREFVAGLWRDWSPAGAPDAAEEVDRVMECLAAPENVTAALGYYRAMLDPARHIERYAAAQDAADARGVRPVLYLHGEEDGCMGADVVAPGGDLAPIIAALPPGSSARLVPGTGHFLQRDRPAEVNRLILDWLAG